MSCSTCGTPHSPTPAPVPAPLPPLPPFCEGSEPCVEVQDTACIAYTGEPLAFLDIDKDDRLTEILIKMNNRFGQVGTGVMYLDGSNQIDVRGNGSAADHYRIRPIIADVPGNLLHNTSVGMVALMTDADILDLLVHIKSSPKLKAAWCGMGCGPTAPPAPTLADLVVSVSSTAPSGSAKFDLTWTNTGTNQVQVEYRIAGTSAWTSSGAGLAGSIHTATIANLLNDTLYEFRVRELMNISSTTNVALLQRTTVTTPTPCAAPTGVSVATSIDDDGKKVLLISLTPANPAPNGYTVTWAKVYGTGTEIGSKTFVGAQVVFPLAVETLLASGDFIGTVRANCASNSSSEVTFATTVVPPQNSNCPSLTNVVALTVFEGNV